MKCIYHGVPTKSLFLNRHDNSTIPSLNPTKPTATFNDENQCEICEEDHRPFGKIDETKAWIENNSNVWYIVYSYNVIVY